MASITTAQQTQIFKIVSGLFNAAPGASYLSEFANLVAGGATMQQLSNALAATTAFTGGIMAGKVTAAAQVQQLMTNFGLTYAATPTAGTAAGDAQIWFTAQIAANRGFGAIVYDAVTALNDSAWVAANPIYSSVATTLSNKAAVAEYYSVTLGTSSTSLAALQSVVSSVTATTPVATTSDLAAAITAGGGSAGTTFTLTTGADNFTGTTGSDTFNAVIDQATPANSTITASDTIAGGAGADVLNVTGTGTTLDVLGGALVSGIETVNIRATTANTLNASQIAGLTAVNANLGAGTVLVTNLATGASVGVIGNGTVVNGEVAFAPATAASPVTLNISGGTKMTAGITAKGALGGTADGTATTATINSTGAANTVGTVDLANGTLTSVTINAATNLKGDFLSQATDQVAATGSVTISGAATSVEFTAALDNDIATINASGLTAGGLTATLGTLSTQKVTGGAGNDVITTSGTLLTTGSVDAGAGTDTLVLGTNVGDANTASLAAKFTNFETLRVNGTFDASLIAGITAVELSGATNAITKMTATQAAAVTGLADIGATTLALATATGTSDVLTLTLGNGKGAAFDTAALTATGFETINIKANGISTNADTTSIIASITDADLTTLNLTGSSVTITDAATTKAVTIDASALTGSGAATPIGLTITGGNTFTGSTITGSAVKDVITALGTGFATYNLGAGNDTVTATVAQLNTGANYNTLNGGGGTDALTINNGPNTAVTIVDNNLSKISGFETVTISTSGTGAQSIQTGGWFDAAFKTNGVDLTTTSTTGNITLDMTSFTGAAKITATTNDGGAATGVANIQTGSGADTITLTTTATTITNVISTFAGNDTIVGNVGKETITGGTGADTMTGGGGADVFVFAAGDTGTPTTTNFDIITDYVKTAGANFDTISAGTLVLGTQVATAGAGVATITTGLATFNAADTTFAQHLVAAEAALHLTAGSPTNGATVAWQEGLNTYVYISDAVAGVGANDVLIQLTGVTAGALTVGGNAITAMA